MNIFTDLLWCILGFFLAMTLCAIIMIIVFALKTLVTNIFNKIVLWMNS